MLSHMKNGKKSAYFILREVDFTVQLGDSDPLRR